MRFTRLVPLFLLTAAASSSFATVTIFVGPGSFDGDQNILFNEDGLLNSGLTVEGITNQSDSIVVFNGEENLTTPAAGQARIEAEDGGFTALELTLEDPTLGFSTLIWNLNAAEDGQVTFTIVRSGGADIVETFDIDGAGENFFRFQAIDEEILSVTLSTTVDLDDVRQIRVGVVPEPAALATLGVGLVAMLRRRRSSR